MQTREFDSRNYLLVQIFSVFGFGKTTAEEMSAPPPPTTSNAADSGSSMSRQKKDCLFFTASLQEGFRNFKAFFVGQAKKLTAKNEQEATQAELQTAKMQVEAADAAEDAKKGLNKSV